MNPASAGAKLACLKSTTLVSVVIILIAPSVMIQVIKIVQPARKVGL